MDRQDHQYLSGFYALALLGVITIVFSLLWPDYSHAEQSFSELGAVGNPNYIAFNILAFGLVGLISMVFFRSLHHNFAPEYSTNLYRVQLGAAIFWILTGVFPASYEIDWLYNVHVGMAFMTYLLGVISISMSLRFMGTLPGFGLYSLISALLLFGVWASILLSLSDIFVTAEWGQLLSIFSYYCWQGGLSVMIYRYCKNSDDC